MPQVTVTLPSGMRGTIRSLRGKEINLFANMSNAKANATTLKILTNVWQETHEDGACYEFAEGVEWGKVLQCDRFTALLYARVATWGAEYSFRLHCGSCRKRYDWSLDLTELEMKPLPEASVETFKAGNKFATTVLDEAKGAIKAWLNDLPMGSMYDLIESLDEHDGGIETEIEVECPHCGAGEEIDLPLDRREFWSPRKLKRS
jgi:hypothetical protein